MKGDAQRHDGVEGARAEWQGKPVCLHRQNVRSRPSEPEHVGRRVKRNHAVAMGVEVRAKPAGAAAKVQDSAGLR